MTFESPPSRLAPRRDWQERLQSPVSLVEGLTYEAWHPFLREEYTEPNFDDDPLYSGVPALTWRPGWTYEVCGPYGEDSKEVWDGEGEQLRTIVSIHKPGRFPTRVFYIRQWRDPDGKVFGKAALRIVVGAAFRAWMRGERWPTYAPAFAAHVRWALCGDGDAKQPSTEEGDAALSIDHDS